MVLQVVVIVVRGQLKSPKRVVLFWKVDVPRRGSSVKLVVGAETGILISRHNRFSHAKYHLANSLKSVEGSSSYTNHHV